ncbi:DNA repair protein RadC [uncultured Holdemanella sp.]|uniref:RadC family protein n=1 Tax=uncultured Holdemanella sp. TaxID=1763549 RepID=UPI0025DACC8C|nr:DNA repair protein RadC [uncultured Holdemanella sp.]
MKVKEMEVEQRPREKALRYGLESLSDLELVALILQSGNKNRSVFEIASDVLKESEGLSKLMQMHVNTLMQIQGIREVKALQLLASVELSKRVIKSKVYHAPILKPEDVIEWFEFEYGVLQQECFIALYLDTKSKLIAHRVLFKGTLNESTVHPREVFKEAFLQNANSVLIAHNHPSGDCTPSQADFEVTYKMVHVAITMGVHLVDHIIVGQNQYYSFKEHKYLD